MASKDRSLRDGNGRVARLARWLSTPPSSDKVDALALEHKDNGEWTRIQIWPRTAVDQSLAQFIDATVVELANELGAYVQARVAWLISDTGAYWTEHAMRVQPEDMEDQQAFSGDAQSIAIQNQRHQERLFHGNLAMMHGNVQLARENQQIALQNAATAHAECERLRERVTELELRNSELEADLARALVVADQAASEAENARAEAGDSDSSNTSKVLSLVQTALTGQRPS